MSFERVHTYNLPTCHKILMDIWIVCLFHMLHLQCLNFELKGDMDVHKVIIIIIVISLLASK